MAISTDSAISLSGIYPKEIIRRKKGGGDPKHLKREKTPTYEVQKTENHRILHKIYIGVV